jgi:cytochrome c oxidase subunit 4
LQVFVALALLTGLEIAAVYMHMEKRMLVSALIALAVTKAAIVALFYMHLRSETRVLKASVAIPISLPAIYALVLIAEGAWRRLPW